MNDHRSAAGFLKTELRLGTGLLQQQCFSMPELSVYYSHLHACENQRLPVGALHDQDVVEMHFTLKGDGFLQDEVSGACYHYRAQQFNMHYLPQFSGAGFHEVNAVYKFFEIKIDTDFFKSLCIDSNPILQEFANGMQRGNIFRPNLPITSAMQQCIDAVIQNPFTGQLKLFYIQSKCLELLALQTEAYEKALLFGKSQLSKDEEAIRFAAKFLLDNRLAPPSLNELAKLAGINTFKLKNGFHQVFGCTAFEYLHQQRLHEATQQLRAGMPIKEVAYTQGYCSVPHFTRAFKKQFGITPGSL
jgi:AraC-like DNA-binding protein